MDAFESLIALLLRREGYWTDTSVKVELTKAQKVAINRPSSARWEIDVVAYRGATNELFVVECKSYFDSHGVRFNDGEFRDPSRFKLFTDSTLRDIVLSNLASRLTSIGMCSRDPTVTLCLATGKIARSTDRAGLERHFRDRGWRLFDDQWVREQLAAAADAGYENDVALIVSKILSR